jgi:hypothetical protein
MKVHLSIVVLASVLGLAIALIVIAGQQPATMGHTSELVIKALPPKSTAKLTVTSQAGFLEALLSNAESLVTAESMASYQNVIWGHNTC